MGVTDGRTSSAEYDDDMQQAKAAGIDAFALNIGTDGFTSNQLGFAYTSADNNGMSVFLSFDFSLYSTSNISGIAQTIADYSQNPAQLTVDSKVFVSSFQGDGLDLDAVQTASGSQLFWAPNFQYKNVGSADSLHGLLNWMAWPNNGNNKAPDSNDNVTVSEGDVNYKNALNGKFYIARMLFMTPDLSFFD